MEKWAVITGASSGIGEELAKLYAKRGFKLVLVARREERLAELASRLNTETRIFSFDLSDSDACFDLFDAVQDINVELLINCAGFGAVGSFVNCDVKKMIKMNDVNCTAVMVLTRLFLEDFKYRDNGAILNVASSAGLLPGGPNMAVYYATKAYVVSLTNAVFEELKLAGSHVKISALCPGPVDTEFNDVAEVKFALKGITPQYCAKCAAWGLDRGKRIIIPEEIMKVTHALSKYSPERLSLAITSFQQRRKT